MKLALIGPHTQTQKDLAGNYFENIGLGTCAGPTCVPKLKTAFDLVNGGDASVVAGCDMKCAKADLVGAVAAAKAADVAILALGIDGDICGEGKDRMDITLPGQQKELAMAVIATGKPVVLLIFSGGLIDIQEIRGANIAIVQGWYPGATGGTAIAQTVFGEHNRFGKLPFTWYSTNFTSASDFDNLNMTDGPGRSYKYLKDPTVNSLWPFAYGLSYTTFSISGPVLSAPALVVGTETDAALTASVTVKNTGAVAGDEVVFLFKKSQAAAATYHEMAGKDPPETPVRELIGFERVALAPGASKTVTFNATVAKLSSVDKFGTRHLLPGSHELVFSRGHGEELQLPLKVTLEAAEDRRLVLSHMVGFMESDAEQLGLHHDEL